MSAILPTRLVTTVLLRCQSARLSTSTQPLRIALLLGSTRTEGPPKPANVGARVGAFAAAALTGLGHTIDTVDPIVEELPLLVRACHASCRSDTLAHPPDPHASQHTAARSTHHRLLPTAR